MEITTAKQSKFKATTSTRDRLRKNSERIVIGLLIVLLLLIEVYPLIWLLLSSIKAPAEFSANPIYTLPEAFHWQNYVDAWNEGMSIYFRNSVLATFPSLFFILTLGVSAAFSFSLSGTISSSP